MELQKKTLGATERDEEARSAFRERLRGVDPERLVFVDESSTNIALTPRYARSPKGERAYGKAPRNWGKNVTLISSISAAEGIMDRSELRSKLAELQEFRETAERELAAIEGRKERLEQMERDRDALLERYAGVVPESLDSLIPEERHQLYKMLCLEVIAYPDKSLEVSGAIVAGGGGWMAGWRRSRRGNPGPRTGCIRTNTDIIGPPPGEPFSETNDNSVAILLSRGTARVLLAGDAEAREEEVHDERPLH